MARQFLPSLVSLSMLGAVSSCGTIKDVTMEEYERNPHAGIITVLLSDGNAVNFDTSNGKGGIVLGGAIVGPVKGGDIVHLQASNVRAIYFYDAKALESLSLWA